MEAYCVSCKKYTANKNCGKKKSTFIKNKELHNFD